MVHTTHTQRERRVAKLPNEKEKRDACLVLYVALRVTVCVTLCVCVAGQKVATSLDVSVPGDAQSTRDTALAVLQCQAIDVSIHTRHTHTYVHTIL